MNEEPIRVPAAMIRYVDLQEWVLSGVAKSISYPAYVMGNFTFASIVWPDDADEPIVVEGGK